MLRHLLGIFIGIVYWHICLFVFCCFVSDEIFYSKNSEHNLICWYMCGRGVPSGFYGKSACLRLYA